MTRWIGIGLGILAVVTIGFIVALSIFDTFRAVTVDIAIIIVALFQIISTLLVIAILIVLLYTLRKLDQLSRTTLVPKIEEATTKVNELIDLVKPRIDTATVRLTEIVDDAKGAADQVRSTAGTTANTTVFIAERVVSPIIRISSLAAGVRAAATVLARRGARPEEVEPGIVPPANSTP